MRAFTVKNLIWTGAQIALAVILLPFAAILVHMILPDDALTVVLNGVQEIPMVGQMLSMLGTLEAELEGGALPSVSEYLLYTVEQVEKASVETAVIGMCVYMCVQIGTLLFIRGVPVLQTIIGVILGAITLQAMQGSTAYALYAAAFMVIANVVLTIFVATGQVVKKILSVFLGLGLQCLLAGFAAGYVALLTMFLKTAPQMRHVLLMLALVGLPYVIFYALYYVLIQPIKL